MLISPHSRDLHRGRLSEPGRIYIVTAVAWNRTSIFRDISNARRASRITHSAATWKGARCLAWVLMPDHWHGLVELQDGDLSRVVARYKAMVSSSIKRATERASPVWQKGFHDRALRKDDDVRAAARYIISNPVRAGLADRVGNYPYWNAIWL